MNTDLGPWTAEKLHDLLGQFEAESSRCALRGDRRPDVRRAVDLLRALARRMTIAQASADKPAALSRPARIRRFVDTRNVRIPHGRERLRHEL